jgi:CheY-like chemotaxis protein
MQDSFSKILIIDDDSRNIFALSAVLKSRGYTCLAASNANEGLQMLLSDKEIFIVLLDMMMPELDGYQTLFQIRENLRLQIPVISVTAQAMVGDREKCLDAGANEYIAKPVDVDILLNVLNRYKT